jgi:DNA repair exonuclease SbcCD ATPase subunit
MAELQEEWESIVQDGKWWRRRWEQLEMKPASLQEIESRALHHNAATEDCTERVERCRAEVRELDELRQRQRDVENQLAIEVADGAPVASEEPEEGSSPEQALVYATMTALRDEAVRVARSHLVLRAGHYLNAISGGRLLGMGVGEEGKVMLLDGGTRVGPVSEEERAAAFLSIRLALAESVAERSDGRFGSLLIGHPLDRLGEEAQHRFAEVLRGLLLTIPQILLFTRGHLVDLAPEAFDAILELRTEGATGPTEIRALPSGMGVLRIQS